MSSKVCTPGDVEYDADHHEECEETTVGLIDYHDNSAEISAESVSEGHEDLQHKHEDLQALDNANEIPRSSRVLVIFIGAVLCIFSQIQ